MITLLAQCEDVSVCMPVCNMHAPESQEQGKEAEWRTSGHMYLGPSIAACEVLPPSSHSHPPGLRFWDIVDLTALGIGLHC